MKTHFFIVIILVIFTASCAKENITPEAPKDSISGRKIRYTVSVINGSKTVGKSITPIKANVSLVMDDSIYVKETDSLGIVYFDYLFAGNVIVKVSCEGYTSVNCAVDLNARPDTANIYDATNLRNVSTVIPIFQTSNEVLATIKGKAFADLDLTQNGLEYAPANTHIFARIGSRSIQNYINTSVAGGITELSYEGMETSCLTDEYGNFELQLPASADGFEVYISADDFAYNQIITSGLTERKIYKLPTDSITIYPGSTKIKDLIFE